MANTAYPKPKNLFVYQGDDWRHEFAHDYLATNVSARGFAIALKAGGTPIYSINHTANAGQLVNADNLLSVIMPTAETLLFDPGTYFYDAQLTVSGTVISISRGSLTVEGHAFDGLGGGMGFATTEISERLIAWTLGQLWSYTSITRDVDGVITIASIRWPDNVAGTLTRTAKNEEFQAITAFTVTYNALTVTQSAITFDVSGRIATRPRPTVA
jgi:hypothetical protein